MKVSDPALRTALFLHSHPGWSPDDLERADPDVVALMSELTNAVAAARSKG